MNCANLVSSIIDHIVMGSHRSLEGLENTNGHFEHCFVRLCVGWCVEAFLRHIHTHCRVGRRRCWYTDGVACLVLDRTLRERSAKASGGPETPLGTGSCDENVSRLLQWRSAWAPPASRACQNKSSSRAPKASCVALVQVAWVLCLTGALWLGRGLDRVLLSTESTE